MTKPMLNSRWPLDPDIEVVVTVGVTSKTVNDNKVSCSLCTESGNINQFSQESRKNDGQAQIFLGNADIRRVSIV